MGGGEYRFRVLASNNDGVWSDAEAALRFRVAPRFYQTRWFVAAAGGLGLLIVWALYRLRVRGIKAHWSAVLNERHRLAREIHDTLAQGLTAISIQLEGLDEMLEAEPDVAREHLDRARRMVRHSLDDARRTVWNLRPQALEDRDLGTVIAEELTAGTALHRRVRVTGPSRPLADEVESNLLRIGQEAITNAVRYAEASSLEVVLHYETDRIRLTVTDDGKGFDVGTPRGSGHFGLAGMRERAAALGGEVLVESRAGAGTLIEAVVPLE